MALDRIPLAMCESDVGADADIDANTAAIASNDTDIAALDGRITTIEGYSLLTKQYESSPTAITVGAVNVFAHGLSAVPKLVQVILKNVTGEYGYVTNDEIILGTHMSHPGGGGVAFETQIDNTNVSLIIGTTGFSIVRKDTFVTATVTVANWNLIVKAFA